MFIKTMLFLVISLFYSGCVPKVHTLSPAIEGVVVDAYSKKAIPDVKVGGTKTDKDGRFFIKGEKTLGISTLVGGIWRLPTVILKVEKESYQTTSYSCSILNTQEGCFDVMIPLYPKTTQP